MVWSVYVRRPEIKETKKKNIWDVIAREISGGFLGGKRRLEASSASVNLVKCRSKKIDLCGFSRPFNRNSTLEDKRRVPTGPNPLHNR
ncbi:hypothetical protein AAC387_Pa04g0548 [Persea americana]